MPCFANNAKVGKQNFIIVVAIKKVDGSAGPKVCNTYLQILQTKKPCKKQKSLQKIIKSAKDKK